MMAKILKQTPTQALSEKYTIKYIPTGYKTLFPKSPYRRITVQGKHYAEAQVRDITLQEEIDMRSEKLHGTGMDVEKPELTIGILFPIFKRRVMDKPTIWQNGPKTTHRYISMMNKIMTNKVIGKDYHYSDFTVDGYIELFGNPERVNTCLTDLTQLQRIGNWAREQIDDNRLAYKISAKPMKIPKPQETDINPLSKAQLKALFGHPDIPEISKLIFRLYLLTGCRISELCRPDFAWIQLDKDKEIAHIKNKGHKGNHDKKLKIGFTKAVHQPLLKEINDYFKYELKHEGSDIYPIPIGSGKIYARLVRARQILGWDDPENPKYFTTHDFRDTAGTYLYNELKDILAVQEQLGHRDPKTTIRKYVDYADKNRVESANSLAQIF
tara:strand:- start:239 stop:1387 length:1149 start_codon:yes stop_codon:yes gene_type:complete